MSVWDSIVGQPRVVDQLRAVSSGDGRALAQSWLICGPPGSGRSHVARAFAAALESPDHGLSETPTRVTEQVLAGTHPDVTTLTTDKVTIGIDDVRSLIGTAEQTPSTAPWRIIIIEDVDRMLERTTNVLLKEIEEPSPRTIWLLCAPSAQDVLPTIRSRTRIVNLGVPDDADVAAYLERSCGADRATAARVARLAEGHIGIAALYACDAQVLADRDELVVGVLGLARASQAVLLADSLIASAKAQAQADVDRQAERAVEHVALAARGLPFELVLLRQRVVHAAQARRHAVVLPQPVDAPELLLRALNSVASVYRDVAVLQNDAEGSVGLVNVENRKAIVDLSVALRREQVIERLDRIAVARRRLIGNVNPQLVFEALFCELIAA